MHRLVRKFYLKSVSTATVPLLHLPPMACKYGMIFPRTCRSPRDRFFSRMYTLLISVRLTYSDVYIVLARDLFAPSHPGHKMGADLKSDAPEVAPSSDPIATNPEHSGPEVAPSSDPIVNRPDYSDIEVVAHQPSKNRNGVDDPYAEKFLRKDGREGRICGLRKVTFWLSLALAVVIIAGAVGGGVGGALANQMGNKIHGGQIKSTR